ncbi:hypothetical protein V8B97DRAFT_2022174 [Scleroderma yunnanense]
MSGNFLPADQPPKPFPEKLADDWSPYSSHSEFELADFLFRHSQMSTANINELLDLWNATLLSTGQGVFRDSAEMYKTIDSTPLGDVKWECFSENVPLWMNDMYNIWYWDPKEVVHEMLSQLDFADDMDY